MHTNTVSTSPQSLAKEAAAARNAIKADAKKENAKQIAELSDGAKDQQAEHIRGMVAATMAHMSIDASAITQENAAQWQQWALGVADGFKRGVPLAV